MTGADERGEARAPLQPWGRVLMALGALALLLGVLVGAAGAPAPLVPYALSTAALGLTAVGSGLLVSIFAALEQKLAETEHALAETRRQLNAALTPKPAPSPVRREPEFRSRPARRRVKA